MNRIRQFYTSDAIAAIVARYRNLVAKAAADGGAVRIMTSEVRRPNLMFSGDGDGRAMLELCTDDGFRHVVFTRWPDRDYFFPENWPAAVPVPNYERDPMP